MSLVAFRLVHDFGASPSTVGCMDSNGAVGMMFSDDGSLPACQHHQNNRVTPNDSTCSTCSNMRSYVDGDCFNHREASAATTLTPFKTTINEQEEIVSPSFSSSSLATAMFPDKDEFSPYLYCLYDDDDDEWYLPTSHDVSNGTMIMMIMSGEEDNSEENNTEAHHYDLKTDFMMNHPNTVVSNPPPLAVVTSPCGGAAAACFAVLEGALPSGATTTTTGAFMPASYSTIDCVILAMSFLWVAVMFSSTTTTSTTSSNSR